jgi:hypothetical protein
VLNPIVALTRLAASLHHENGTIAVPGFYECALPDQRDNVVKAPFVSLSTCGGQVRSAHF